MRKLRQMMLSYVRMERDINIFMTAAEDVMKQVEVVVSHSLTV